MEKGEQGWRWRALLAVALIGAAAACFGCKTDSVLPDDQILHAQVPDQLEHRSLAQVKGMIAEDASSLTALKADCSVVITSPLIRRPQASANVETRRNTVSIEEGQLLISKPGKVLLKFYGPGQLYIRLVGDGTNYRVDMPLIGNTKYAGEYGNPISPRPDRLHFMPDDLVDAFDLNRLFAGKTQVMRTFPYEWQIDSLVVTRDAGQTLKVVNAIGIDRRADQIIRMDKFNEDSSLRVRMWFQNHDLVEGTGGHNLQVPTRVSLWYPMEGTLIVLLLRHITINEYVGDDAFLPQAWTK